MPKYRRNGHVRQVKNWPYSSFHTLVKAQVYPPGWAGCVMGLDVGERD